MNLLLLLSALLSALSGVGGAARPSAVPVAVARAAEVTIARQARVAVAARPVVAAASIADMLRVGLRPIWRLAAVTPPYASRRRE